VEERVATWIKTIEKRIQNIADERDQNRWSVTKELLRMTSYCYRIGVRLRTRLYERGILATRHLTCTVIAVGNLTAGGTGKTPMAMYIAQLIKRLGKRVVVISRGYRGSAEQRGGVVSDGRQILMSPAEAGDEPYMMAQKLGSIPVMVGRSRYMSGMQAVRKFQAEVVILDDAFQHIQLHRNLNLLLLDAKDPFGNGFLLPRGKLREPVAAVNRADAIVYTRSDGMLKWTHPENGFLKTKPVFKSIHRPMLYKVIPAGAKESKELPYVLTPISNDAVGGFTVYAFAGIANNAEFKQTIESLGMQVYGFRSFSDHHMYSERELEQIASEMQLSGAQWLITTEKDYYRIHTRLKLPHRILVVGIEICFGEHTHEFDNFVISRLYSRFESEV